MSECTHWFPAGSHEDPVEAPFTVISCTLHVWISGELPQERMASVMGIMEGTGNSEMQSNTDPSKLTASSHTSDSSLLAKLGTAGTYSPQSCETSGCTTRLPAQEDTFYPALLSVVKFKITSGSHV